MITHIRFSVSTLLVALLFAFGLAMVPTGINLAHAQEATSTDDSTDQSTIEAMLAQIQQLMELIASLQEQLNNARGQIQQLLKDGLQEGMTDEDIAKIQELLATDPSIYPEGLVTGYFGPLTKNALRRFQLRHGANPTGEIDQETKDLLEEYLEEGFGDRIPPGLLRAPGIIKKVEIDVEGRCETRRAMGPLCKKLRIKYESDDDDDEDEDMDEDEDEHEDGDEDDEDDEHGDEVTEGDAQDALDAAQSAIDDAQDAIDSAMDDGADTSDAEELLDDAEAKLADAQDAFDSEDWHDAQHLAEEAEELADDAKDSAEEADAPEDFSVVVTIDNGDTTVSFTFEDTDYDVVVVGSTAEEDVLDAVAAELGVDAADLDEDLSDQIKNELEDAISA